ncbi:MAG: hypothetical protein ACYC2P_08610 [Paludibacteraceae bacterium]
MGNYSDSDSNSWYFKIKNSNTSNGEFYTDKLKSLPITKGDWEVIKIDISDYKSLCIGSRSDNQVICNISPGNFHFLEKENSNAKLISAGPDLLLALSKLYDSLPDGYTSDCIPLVRKALNKAGL